MPTPPDIPCTLITRVLLEHCARGSNRCAKCAAVRRERFCILNTCPSGDYARPMISISGAGWRVYDVVREFDTEAEARAHAAEAGIFVLEAGG